MAKGTGAPGRDGQCPRDAGRGDKALWLDRRAPGCPASVLPCCWMGLVDTTWKVFMGLLTSWVAVT